MLGFKQYKRKFVYDHGDAYIVFMLIRSYYSATYYVDFNLIIKALHPDAKPPQISWEDFDFIGQPRLRLSSKMFSIELEIVDLQEYERLLQKSLEKFLKGLNKKGLKFLTKYSKISVLSEDAKGFLSKY